MNYVVFKYYPNPFQSKFNTSFYFKFFSFCFMVLAISYNKSPATREDDSNLSSD